MNINYNIMNLKPIIILITIVFMISSSCTTLKRYNSLKDSAIDNSLAGIDLFGFTLAKVQPANGYKTLWDLSADAQAQYIRILNSRYPDNDKFIDAMSYEYLDGKEEQPAEDYVTKDLRLIFSVSKLRSGRNSITSSGVDLSPADRIEYLKITLKIPEDSKLRFTGWNMFTTEYGSVDIADISFSRSLELEASGLLTSDSKRSAAELSAGEKSTVSRREDQEIRYRYLKLNGRINNKKIEMEEEGIREIDLTGNITADVSLEFERFPEIVTKISGFTDSTGRFNEPEKLRIRYSDVSVPVMENVKDTLFAELRMDYIFRNVLKGKRTFPEWDDRIKYYNGSVTKNIPVFTLRDYVPEFYCIGIDDGSYKREIIKISASPQNVYSMIFTSYTEASAFYEWLNHYCSKTENSYKVVSIGGQTLKFRDNDLSGRLIEDYPRLRILPCYR